MRFDEHTARMLEMIVCPACRGPLAYEADRLGCAGCGRAYRMQDGIPVLIAERAIAEDVTPGR